MLKSILTLLPLIIQAGIAIWKLLFGKDPKEKRQKKMEKIHKALKKHNETGDTSDIESALK